MRRFWRIALGVLLALIVATSAGLAWLTLTTSGARWAAELTQRYVAGLSIRVTGGRLATGLDVEDFSLREKGESIKAASASFRWRPECLLYGKVCVDRFAVDALQVNVSSSAGGSEKKRTGSRSMRLPVEVRFSRIVSTNARIRIAGDELRWDRLESSASYAGRTLRLAGTRVRGVHVAMASAGSAGPAGAAPREAVALPKVSLPWDVVVDGFSLDQGKVVAGESTYGVNHLTLAGSLRGTRLRIHKLTVVSPRGALDFRGHITLSGDYPLKAAVHVQVPDVFEKHPMEGDLDLAGSVARLKLDLRLSAPLQARANGTLEPLKPQLPFDLTLRSKRVQWPLAGKAKTTASDVSIRLRGDRAGYGVTAETDVQGREVPPVKLKLIGTGTFRQLHVTRLTAAGLDGTVDASGRVAWQPGLRWNVDARIKGINPGVQWAKAQGRVDGHLHTEGRLGADGLALKAVLQDVKGRFRGYDLDGRLSLSKQPGADWSIRDARLVVGPNRVTAQGTYGARWNVHGRAHCPELSGLWPGLSGRLEGHFSANSDGKAPDIRVEATAHSLAYQGAKADQVRLDLRINGMGQKDGRIALTAKDASMGDRALGTAAVELTGSLADHHLRFDLHGGAYTARLALSGGFDERMIWRGRLQSAHLGTPVQTWSLAGRPVLQWSPPAQALVVTPHCWVYRKANVCATEPLRLGAAGHVGMKLSGYELAWFQEWMPAGVVVQGALSGNATVDWKPGELPRASGKLTAQQGQVVLATAGPAREGVGYQPLQLPYKEVVLGADTQGRSVSLTLSLDSSALGRGRAKLNVQPSGQTYQLAGNVGLRGLQVAIVSPFFPKIRRIAGHVSADGTFGGTVTEPRFDGQIKLADGEVAGRDLPMKLSDLGATIEIHGQQASLDGEFSSGKGKATLKGSADWGGQAWQAQVSLKGDKLAVAYESIANFKVSPDLTLRLQPQKASVSGRIDIPEGKITLKELPEQAVTVSNDVVIVNQKSKEGPGSQPLPKQWSVQASVEVALGDNVTLKGFGVRGRLAGSLKVRQVVSGVPEAFGEIRIEDGRYEAYGQKLTIRSGRLIFSGPVSQPDLYVEAVRKVQNVTAGLRIQGSPQNPDVTLFSDPTMSQQEVLSYLILGHAPGQGSTVGQNALLTQAAVSLGVLGGKGYASAVAKELGIKNFEVGTSGEGNQTQFVVSGYLAPNLYLSYGVGLFVPVNTFTVHYDLTQNVYLEAVTSLESALDIYYSFKY